MRLGAIFGYELRLQLRRPTLLLYLATLLGLSAIVAQGGIASAQSGEALFDAPVEVASVLMIATIAGLLTAAALAADGATRDASTRMAPLFAVTPLRRHEYLGGRFLAAFVLYALALLLVPIGHLVARFFISPDLVLPLRPMTYVETYLFVSVPNAFISVAFLFAVAALTRRAVATYVAAAVLLVWTMVSFQLSVNAFAASNVAGLFDPFAFSALRRTVAGWTVAQRNVLPVALEGELLWNRVLWMTVACAALAVTWWRAGASRGLIPSGAWRARKEGRALPAPEPSSRQAAEPIPHAARAFGPLTAVHQTWAIARRAFLDVALSWGALLIVGFAVFHVVIGPELMEHLGVPLHPTTAAVVRILTGMSTGIPMLSAMLAIFYAGELIWNDRDLRLAPLTGSTPVSGWALLLGKFLGLALVLAALEALLVVAGVVTQAMLGYYELEPLVYLQTVLGLQLAYVLLFAALAMAIQVVAGGKYAGWLAAVLAWVWTVWPDIQPEHPMLLYGATPGQDGVDGGWTYSGMSGFGASLEPVLWFTAYWAAWALLFAFVARLLIVRGMDLPFRERLTRARRRFTPATAFGAAAAAGAVCGLGGFIFWNTNILNEYTTADELTALKVDYERRYGMYEGVPQPVIAATSLEVELYPGEQGAMVSGSYVLRNDTGVPIDTLHLAVTDAVETGPFELDRPARAAVVDDELRHRIHVLESPLAPGDSLTLGFRLAYAQRGFSNDGAAGDVVENGTFFELQQWLPGVGYQPGRELPGDYARREHGLPPRPELLPEDRAAVTRQAGLEEGRFRIVIGTDSGQTAVASGVLRRSWTDGGRAWFEYEAATPIRRRVALLSARYDVHRDTWQGIPIEVFHHPGHPWNAERMVRSVKATLEHFTRAYGPYPYGVVRVVERPEVDGGATAYPGMVGYSEPIALMRPDADDRGLDFQFAVMAHEMAHQWWGNQFVPASVAGAGLLSESLAWYGAYGVVEETYGRRHLETLLDLMHEAYLQPMQQANVPLIHADDWFLAYRKGAFAMYAMREYLGEERVTAALRGLFEAHADGRLPHPTSLDLVAALKAVAPDSLRPLVHDLFEENVWWDFGIRQARGRQLPSGEWEVTVQLRAMKQAIDTAANETLLPLNEPVEIGLYAEDPAAEPLYRRTHWVREREETITIILPGRPASAAVNPRHLLGDRVGEDDWRPVVMAQSGPANTAGSSP